ncbi:MAG TPA: hypothetical protein VL334_25950 [Anaerolineae bacterium]|nr:hypothetical protein [Anaerolineae bacterium]
MRTYSVEKIVSKNGTVQLEALPFPPGERVEVIVLARKDSGQTANLRTLTGSVLKFEQPFDPIAEEDWDALQ